MLCFQLRLVPRSVAIQSKLHRHRVAAMFPGSGIGPEMMRHVQEIFSVAKVPVDFEIFDVEEREDEHSFKLLQDGIESVKRHGVALKGNIRNKIDDEHVYSKNIALRKALDLFVNVVHVKSLKPISTRYGDLDVVLIRQNTEGEYSTMEHESVPGVVESLKIVSKSNAERVINYAFNYAKDHGRHKITTVHKANIMKISDGLFLKTAQKIATHYPWIEHDDVIIDNFCMQLIKNPHQFDVISTQNLYGSIIVNILCGLVHGAGVISGRNVGEKYALFEPACRHSADRLVGKNLANPLAMLNASVDMLRYLGYYNHAKIIRKAINQTLNVDKIFTEELGGKATTTEVVENIEKHIKLQQQMQQQTQAINV